MTSAEHSLRSYPRTSARICRGEGSRSAIVPLAREILTEETAPHGPVTSPLPTWSGGAFLCDGVARGAESLPVTPDWPWSLPSCRALACGLPRQVELRELASRHEEAFFELKRLHREELEDVRRRSADSQALEVLARQVMAPLNAARALSARGMSLASRFLGGLAPWIRLNSNEHAVWPCAPYGGVSSTPSCACG